MSEKEEKEILEIRKSEDSGYFYASSKSQKTEKDTEKNEKKNKK